MKNILVTGSLAFDYIMDFPDSYENHILPDKIKTLSVSFLVDNLNKNFGGNAGNIAYTLSLLKQKPILFSSIGKNDCDTYFKHFKKNKIDASNVAIINNQFSANAFIITDKNDCQITGFYQGALNEDSKLSLEKINKKIDFLVIAPTATEAMNTFVKQAKKQNIPYVYNPAQQLNRIPDEELRNGISGAEIVICNDYELDVIIKKTKWNKKQLLEKTKIFITTLGEKGSVIETKNEKTQIGIVKIKKFVDPTGAGDSYIAGFIAGYTGNKSLKESGQMGATAASFAIEHYGTQNHKFTLEEFKKRKLNFSS